MVNQDSLKDMFKNLKKGAQIGVLGTALTAGSVLGVGCSQPTSNDENKKTEYVAVDTTTIGNGYVLPNFADNTYLVDDYYGDFLKVGENYIKGLADQFDKLLKADGRTLAQNYFANLINAVQNNNNFYYDEKAYEGVQNLDRATNTISRAVEPILEDIIKNIDRAD